MTLSTAGKLGMGAFTPVDRVVWSRVPTTPLVVGNLVMLNHAASGTETVEGDVEDGRPGMDSAIESNVIAPVSPYLKHGIFAVVIDLMNGAGADNTKVLVRFQGLVDVGYDDTAALDAGEACYAVTTDVNALADVGATAAAVGEKYLGYLREAVAIGTPGVTLGSTMFDGVNGIGSAFDQA